MRSVLTKSNEYNFNEESLESLSNRGIQSRPTSSPVVEMLGEKLKWHDISPGDPLWYDHGVKALLALLPACLLLVGSAIS